jgi:hypothetical protein
MYLFQKMEAISLNRKGMEWSLTIVVITFLV